MMTPRLRSIAGMLTFLLLAGSTLSAQDRVPARSGAAAGRSAASNYGVPYWQTAAGSGRSARSIRDDGMAPRLYERQEEPAPPPRTPTPRRNYYPGMRGNQYANPNIVRHCSPSRSMLAGRR